MVLLNCVGLISLKFHKIVQKFKFQYDEFYKYFLAVTKGIDADKPSVKLITTEQLDKVC